MTIRISKRAAGVAAGIAVLVGAGAAIGASSDSNDFLADVAKRLGVSQDQLEQAIVGARSDQVDKALADGKITKDQADALKKRLESGDLGPGFGQGPGPGFGHGPGPGFGPGDHPGFGHHGAFGGLAAAATYLGVTETELHTALESGKSLADVAKAKGKSVDGLKQAIIADGKKQLADAVEAGRLTQAQADEISSRLAERVDDLVTRAPGDHPGFGPAGQQGFGGGSGRPPLEGSPL